MHAKRKPDGSFEYDAIQYRLEQASDDSFDVVREDDRAVVGRLDHDGFPADMKEHLAKGWQSNYWDKLASAG